MKYLESNIVTFSDYYPFGMLMPERNGGGDYRYGFQNQEVDNEIKGKGNSVNYKYRMHDARLGRFFAVDPLTSKYPHYTPYSFSGNKVIQFIELEGLEESLSCEMDGTPKQKVARSNQLSRFFTKQIVEIVSARKQINVNASKLNGGLNRNFRIRTSATITFNAFNIQDGISISNLNTGVVQGNAAQQFQQQYNTTNGIINVRVTPNPLNQNSSTLWNLNITDNSQRIKKKTKYKIFGLTVMSKVETQWIDATNPANNGPKQIKRKVLGIVIKRNTDRRNGIRLTLTNPAIIGRRRGQNRKQNSLPKPKKT